MKAGWSLSRALRKLFKSRMTFVESSTRLFESRMTFVGSSLKLFKIRMTLLKAPLMFVKSLSCGEGAGERAGSYPSSSAFSFSWWSTVFAGIPIGLVLYIFQAPQSRRPFRQGSVFPLTDCLLGIGIGGIPVFWLFLVQIYNPLRRKHIVMCSLGWVDVGHCLSPIAFRDTFLLCPSLKLLPCLHVLWRVFGLPWPLSHFWFSSESLPISFVRGVCCVDVCFNFPCYPWGGVSVA